MAKDTCRARWGHRRLGIILGALLGAMVSQCTPAPSMRGPQALEQEYEIQLHKWTTGDSVHHSLDRILYVYATYLSPEFRKAFGQQYMHIFGIDPDRVDSDLEMIATSVGRGHEFFVFVDTSDVEWNNLDEKDSVWRMALWGGEEQLGTPPLSIHRFRGRGPNKQAFFPYQNEFGMAYYVIFPLDQANGRPIVDGDLETLRIKMASAFGTVDLNWKVDE